MSESATHDDAVARTAGTSTSGPRAPESSSSASSALRERATQLLIDLVFPRPMAEALIRDLLAEIDRLRGQQGQETSAVLDELRKVVRANGSQKETARVFCISPQYLNDILAGRREISAEVAELLGYQRVVTFVPLPAAPRT